MQEYGELEVANGYLGDPEGLNEAFERQGYLFFRGVLDADEIGAVRSDFMAELGRQGFVAPGASRPVWTGRDLEELDDDRLYALDYYPKLLDTDTTRTFTERFFGGPVFMFRPVPSATRCRTTRSTARPRTRTTSTSGTRRTSAPCGYR